MKLTHLLTGAALIATPIAAQDLSPVAHPDLWPKVAAQPKRDPAVEAKIDRLLTAMSIEDKVGQLLQVDIASIKPEDVKTYKLGSILNGGNSAPNGDELAPPIEWLKLADAFYDASMQRSDGRPAIPIIWGTDAVHGNNNIVGATLFPHNIGLGAAHDPELIRRIGEVTAAETAAAGIDWTFAPTLAVVQDDRWGRTYESYSEEPEVQKAYAGKMIEGVQGRVGTSDFLSPTRVIATTKHFLGDGGTGGRDQGDTRVPETVLRDVHLGGYPQAIAAGTQSVMASFSGWNGVKMHGNRSLLTGVLKDRMGFDGFVVGDWNGHGQVEGCTNESCAAAINAGLDMFMYSGDGWKQLYANTLAQAKSGEITPARLDDAVRRILRVKLRAGTFDRGRPSSRQLAGKMELIGAPTHRAVARQAVAESLVLLKNENRTLPLSPKARILVAGKAADSIAQQSGGWSITWQGTGVDNKAFPNGQSIWSGIRETVEKAGGTATYAPDGAFTDKPDAAIVVFGEEPYAEFKGDRPNLEFSPGDKADLALMAGLKAKGVPVVAVFLSGRPLWVNAELNASDAFVAAFLPGSEGGGVSDVLFRKVDGTVNRDFHGKLTFSWPKRPDQYVLNRRDPGYDPLFAYGYGLTYQDDRHLPKLDESRPAGMETGATGTFFGKGRLPDGWTMTAEGAARIVPVDRRAQEDSRRLTWAGAGKLILTADKPVDLGRETNGELSLVIEYKVDRPATAPVVIGMANPARSADVHFTAAFTKVGDWTSLAVPLRCFASAGLDMSSLTRPFILSAAAPLDITLSDIRIESVNVPMDRCGG
ncbi:glycoside hydrolase family 3 N-terminal domain-containing protein [Sphingomonas sp. ID0503]|uniref:glycoside hydrolase family 3 protein n=1 Tax=Sphingomonas sp. ID0503 TaxID=3399691 RepID=UPI003AFA9AB1